MEREKNMIKTGEYRNYGQMNDHARKETTVEEYAWQGGKLVKVDPASATQGPIIHTSEDKVFAK